ncbi:SWP12 [Ecytonucleospora hepatopenaei]|uniref:SWP12 n=1 Tax=Ecytonucleospora hepatopenaei TaxID=646526 RepID=A0A1W0E726_9MICR|nr:SWP12 [Ecytonucleospora hepatopenaei]
MEAPKKVSTAKIRETLKNTQKKIAQKFKSIDYVNTDLNPGFLELEEEFKNIRNTAKMLKDCLLTFKNYEYGHSILKNVYNGFEWVEKKLNTEIVSKKELYGSLAEAGTNIAKFTHDKNRKELAIAFQNSYLAISDYKKSFNSEVKQLILNIDILLSKAEEISSKRKQIRTIRYDLEMAILDDNYDNDLVKSERKKLSGECKQCMSEMNEFIKDKSIGKIIKKFQKLHCKFYRQIYDELDVIEHF